MNAALIGCGRIGFLLEKDPLRNKPCTHFGGACAARIRITCAADIDSGRLAAFKSAAGLTDDSCFDNYKTLLEVKKPELVIIALPTPLHSDAATAAANAGAKLIVLEKPIAHSLSAASKLIASCDAAGAKLIINHERRFDARYQKVKAMLDSGIIGELRSVHCRILTGGYRGNSLLTEGGGPLLHDGTHLVDIVRFFCGNIALLSGEFKRFGNRTSGYEDAAAAWLKTDAGVDVFIEAGGGYKHFVFEIELFGTEGKIIIGNGYEALFKSKKSKYYVNFKDLASVKFPAYKKNNCFAALYGEVKKAAQNPSLAVQSSWIDGYKALEIIHAIYYSGANGGKQVALPIDPKVIRLDKIFGIKK